MPKFDQICDFCPMGRHLLTINLKFGMEEYTGFMLACQIWP